MSLYVLDTDILTLYQFGNAAVSQHVASHPASELAIAIISVEEQLSSWYTLLRQTKKRDELARVYRRLTDNVRFLAKLQILSFTETAIDEFEKLKAMKLGVRAPDLRIAAIALDHGASIATRNVRDFGRVPNLAIEDWSK